MADISLSAVRACYDAALQVRAGNIAPTKAVASVVAKTGVTHGSMLDYIYNVRRLLNGRSYTRTMNPEATENILAWVKADFGAVFAQGVARKVLEHVAYYAALPRGGPQVKVKRAAETFLAGLPLQDLATMNAAFEVEVEAAAASSSAERAARLSRADPIPKLISVATKAFVRNADVVVEVLIRAAGRCEWCKKAAPFVSQAKSAPYLEVHHRTPLAHNGHDTVENAIALCPNCHREAHFGVNSSAFRK